MNKKMTPTEITLDKALEVQAANRADKPFILHANNRYSYGETKEIVSRLATYFVESGIGPGDKIGIMLPRVPELIFSFLAATKIGALPAPISYLVTPSEQIEFVKRLDPAGIISDEKLLSQELADVFMQLGPKVAIDVAGKHPGWTKWNQVPFDCKVKVNWESKPGDVAYLNFTTGSSGQPKGALATHANIYWNTRSAIDVFDLTEKDTHLCMFSSVAHPHELFARALYTGGTAVLLEEIKPKTVLNVLNRHSVSCIMGLAPMYELMATYCATMNIPSLRIVESGGMYTKPKTNQNFQVKFGLPILSVWGSTETTGIALANKPGDYRTDGTMGKVCPYYQVKLVDDNRNEVQRGQVGELLFKGPGVIPGYENEDFFQHQGWYCSGDMAREDEEGYYYFMDRKSGMIKVAGLKVYPLQVELLLQEHPKIQEVAVIGVENKRKGAVTKAFIVSKQGAEIPKKEVLSFCAKKIPSYMIPKQLQFISELPKIGSGKIDKKALIVM